MTELKDTNLNEEITNEALSEIEMPINDIPTDLSDFTENKVHSYTKLSDKYNDIMSSASTMLIVGIVGIIFMILVFTKIIPLPLSSETSWLFNSVMGGVFIIFVISGIISFMHAKKVKFDADEEDILIKEILDWANFNIFSKDIDTNTDLTQPEEILYFGRTDIIKDMLMHQFENADEALIMELTEQIYQKLYESENGVESAITAENNVIEESKNHTIDKE